MVYITLKHREVHNKYDQKQLCYDNISTGF